MPAAPVPPNTGKRVAAAPDEEQFAQGGILFYSVTQLLVLYGWAKEGSDEYA